MVIIFGVNFLIKSQQIDSCSHELKGVILDIDTKEVLPYVRVNVKGTKHATQTNIDGEFHIKGLCNKFNTLIISCYGYCDTTCTHFHQHSKNPHIHLKQEIRTLGTVTIKVEKDKDKGTKTIAQETIKKDDLVNTSQTLAATISEMEGVTFTSTGNNVQLPVIHGLYGNRVLVLNNGVIHGFQNWGMDHAPEIDISTANSLTVIKGAAGVRYGPSALGGAIIVNADPLYLNEKFKAKVGTGYQTNGRGYFVNTEMGQGLKKWSYHIGANYNRIGDQHTPDYSLTNSGKKEMAVNAGLRYHLENLDFKAYYSYINQDLALIRSSVAESGTSFSRAINSDTPIIIKPFSYQINEPNQQTQHQLGKLEVNWYYSNDAKLKFILSRQLNQREEYDVRRNADKPITNLNLITNDYQLEWKHPDWLKLDGLLGVQMFTQDNDNNPGTGTTPFIPNYNILRYSTFMIESFEQKKNTYEVGVRFDYEYNNVRGRELNQDIFTDKYSFRNLTSSLGYIRHVSENTTFRTNIGTAWRTPNMAELYSFGQHGFKTSFGLLRYYFNENNQLRTNKVLKIDESNISPEKGYKWVNELKTQAKKNTYTITLYTHYIENFIFDRPMAVIGTFRGPMPVFIMDQANSLFVGTDFTWQKKWSKSFHGTWGISYLWSQNIKKNEPLINQPPLTTNYKLVWKSKKYWKFDFTKISLKPSYTFTQFQAPRTIQPDELISGEVVVTPESEIFDFKSTPTGFFLLDITGQVQFKQFKIGVSIQNILNTNYRNYLNDMRYFVDESGRNFLFTINYKFKTKS